MAPDMAEVVGPSDTTRTVPVSDVRIGDVVVVRPGDRVLVDGRVCDGAAECDERGER